MMLKEDMSSLLSSGFLAIQKNTSIHIFLNQMWVSSLLLIIKNSFIAKEIALTSYCIGVKELSL
jgi:hypothetical protein